MKKIIFSLFLSMMTVAMMAQGMTDSQVAQFIQREMKAGATQSQIVTKLMQRGVKIDQIRRVRNQYEKQQQSRTSANYDETSPESRLRKNQQEQDNAYTSKGYQQELEARNGKQVLSGMDSLYRRSLNPDDELYYLEDSLKTEAQKTKVFGRDIFNNRALTFEPAMNIATPQNYLVGPGDQIIVDVYGASQRTVSETVSPDGTSTIPGYGPIQLSGLSVSAAKEKLRSTLGSRYASSRINMTVGQTRSILINVMGEVKVPGTYTLSAFATVFHALYMAGGINDLGTLRNIKVFRGGHQISTVDIYDYILNGRMTGNVRLQDNDVIIVGPYDALVEIEGNVKRPMFYEMRKNESVSTLLKYAGGFSGNAYKKSVRLLRKTGRLKSVYNVEEFDMSSFQVDDGDVVSVDSILDRYENMVEVKGAIFRPGLYQLGNEINSVRSLIQHAEGVTEDAFTNRGVMHRLKEDRTLEVIPVDVKGILAGTSPDIPLKNEDVLFIPTQSDLQQQRTLTIHGEVMYPGPYQYADNETLEDLILQAGGLTDAASTAKVDVSRRIVDPKATTSSKVIAKTYSFSLKDGFVIDGTPGFVLEPYDEVYVRRSPGYQAQRNITVSGEVLFEGEQTLSSKTQRLTDAIKAAGGVTPEAYVKGARLERRLNEDERARRSFLLKQLQSQISGSDSVVMNQLDLGDTYTVGIYLDKALENPGSEYDVVLREGDNLIVPEYNGTVKVSGNVMYPNTVVYHAGKNYKYYINQAGGYGNHAKRSKTWVIYQNGTMAQVGHGAKIEPGCEIVVPTKPKSDPARTQQWISIAQSVFSMAAMVTILIKQF
jgi:protein involved in polysaccharide export with SLBB domain